MRKHLLSCFRLLGGTFAIAIVAVSACNSAMAGMVYNYGNFVGSTVKYVGVTEVPTQFPGVPADAPLFDAPSLLGDTLDFDPLFSLMASGGSSGFQDSQLKMDVMSVNNFDGIDQLVISEGGGYAVGGGTSATFAQQALVFPLGEVFITAINGAAVTPISVPASIQYTFTPVAGPFVTTTNNSIKFDSSAGVNIGGWNAVATFDVAGAMAAAGKSGSATMLEVTLDNILAVQSELASFAFIDKKDFKIGLTHVPEPTAITLGLLGGLGLFAAFRRAKRSS